MSQHNRILILGGFPKMLRSAKNAGLEVISIQKQSEFRQEYLEHIDQTFIFDYEDTEALLPIVKGIYAAYPFQSVNAIFETGLIPAAMINDMLGLSGNSLETVQLLKDKLSLRRLLNSKGISYVAADGGNTREDIENFGRLNGWPVIVKPTDQGGSFGIFYIAGLAQVEDVWRQIQDLELESFVIEEYLEGPEVSVEAFSFNGKHVIIAVTDKLTLPNFVEYGHSVPAQIDEALKSELVKTVTAMLDAVGLANGPSHTELRLTKKGPRIVESHNRVGGDKIHDLVELAYGIDMISMSSTWPFKLVDALTNVPKPHAGAAIRFFTPPPGIVKDIIGVNEVKAHPAVDQLTISTEVGKRISSICQSRDRSGYLITKAGDVREAIALCDELVKMIQFKIE